MFDNVQGHFPEAEKDPVIQIASMVTEQGKDKPTVRNVMTLNSCAPIVGAEVMSFANEAELLKVMLTICLSIFCVTHAPIMRSCAFPRIELS